jgi:hypothetical protein
MAEQIKEEKKTTIICPDCQKKKAVPYRGFDKCYNICIECTNNTYGDYKRDN